MQLITVLSTASALIAGASARSAVQLNESCDKSKPYARVINRCPYDVYLWSVFRGDGCPTDQMVTLKTGETYSENYQTPENGVGISIKLSKTQQCKHQSLTQLEYYLETSKPGFSYNYLDVSYVDCQDNDCPTRQEGYYLQSGSQTGAAIASAGNTWCPILSCNDQASCNKCSYVNPDDVQTKTCDLDQNMDFYMCGGEGPSGDDYSSAPSSSSSSESEKPAPTSAANYGEKVVEAAAAVTPAPVAEAKTHTHTEIVYATVYEYVNAKRHAHGHARRHQNFHA